jgi:lipid II:glycine glycyltransferase (peptidoglycan interpeptide bridge formation enzyme)
VRLSRARWFIFCGLRALDELDADVGKEEEADGAEKAVDRAKKIAKARSYVKDALLSLKDMVATKRVTPLLEEQCAIAELSALKLQLRLDRVEKKLDANEREKIQQRMDILSGKLKADEFRQRASGMVDAFGNPKRPK